MGTLTPRMLEKHNRIQTEAVRDAFERLQRQVPLAALKAAHVGAMNAEHRGEGLLRQPLGISVRTKISPNDPLQVPFHGDKFRQLLLDGLHTYK